MSLEYAKVLQDLDVSFNVVTRGSEKATHYFEKTGINPFIGGLTKFIDEKYDYSKTTHAIVAVNVEALLENCLLLINMGVKNLLIEKPGGINTEEIEKLALLAEEKQASVYIAYNRRFYASVSEALNIIKKDGGVDAFHFEFTEWGHKISNLNNSTDLMAAWFLANSSHVADMAFFLGGKPESMASYTAGGNSWHPSATIFAGSGRSVRGALFTYKAHWEAPGRWGVEVITKKNRLIFSPLEKLFIQKIGELQANEVEIDNSLDKKYKPGIYNQVKHWLSGSLNSFLLLQEQAEMTKWYKQIANY